MDDLSAGDIRCIRIQDAILKVSNRKLHKIYGRMDIVLEEFGESFYIPMLTPMVDKLIKEDIAIEYAGTIVIPSDKNFNNKNLVIRNYNGGYTHGTTNMAVLNYQVNDLKADRVIYVTDDRNEFHIRLLFEACKLANFYDPEKTNLELVGVKVAINRFAMMSY